MFNNHALLDSKLDKSRLVFLFSMNTTHFNGSEFVNYVTYCWLLPESLLLIFNRVSWRIYFRLWYRHIASQETAHGEAGGYKKMVILSFFQCCRRSVKRREKVREVWVGSGRVKNACKTLNQRLIRCTSLLILRGYSSNEACHCIFQSSKAIFKWIILFILLRSAMVL